MDAHTATIFAADAALSVRERLDAKMNALDIYEFEGYQPTSPSFAPSSPKYTFPVTSIPSATRQVYQKPTKVINRIHFRNQARRIKYPFLNVSGWNNNGNSNNKVNMGSPNASISGYHQPSPMPSQQYNNNSMIQQEQQPATKRTHRPISHNDSNEGLPKSIANNLPLLHNQFTNYINLIL
jgi:hypothetical protein